MNRLDECLLMPRSDAEWSIRNQAWLMRRFAFWRDALSTPRPDIAALPIDEPPPYTDGFEPAALQVAREFGLSVFERELTVLATGAEIDASLRTALAVAQRRSTGEPCRLDFSLALGLLPEPHWDALSPSGPLRHWSMLEFDTTPGFLVARLRIDERMMHHLTGVAAWDARLAGVAKVDDALAVPTPLADRIAARLRSTGRAFALLGLADGSDAASQSGRAAARAASARLGTRLIWVDAAALADATGGDPRQLLTIARALDREAKFEDGIVGVAVDAGASSASIAVRLLGSLQAPAVVVGSLSPAQLGALPERKALCFPVPKAVASPLAACPEAIRNDVAEALQQFQVGPAAVEQAIVTVADEPHEGARKQAIWNALRESARGGLDGLAQRIESRATLADLVVPPLVAAQLREIAGQLEQRDRVYHEWGFATGQARGLGIAALFAGESGTGKTLAAEAIANEVRLDLYRVDLAQLVSKYIGETERNLAQVFDAAERSGAVLLFDEADALFGKRSEVRDSHDRYANIEVAYLLQRIESYRGLAILTSNTKSALDRAFLRRLRFLVQMPFPDASARSEIWRRQFPPRAPVGAIDFAALGRLPLAGGSIRSVALNAAFAAAANDRAIGQVDLMAAARAEFAKLERPFSEAGGAPVP